jgi:hypothetical protein
MILIFATVFSTITIKKDKIGLNKLEFIGTQKLRKPFKINDFLN